MTELNLSRLFTVEEANALLPRLRPMVGELQTRITRLREALKGIQQETGLDLEDPALQREFEKRSDLAELVAGVQSLVERIHREGAVVNGPEEGLLDFPALLDGEIVFLCWQPGESSVAHWHRIPDGFAGRRPLLDGDDPGFSETVH